MKEVRSSQPYQWPILSISTNIVTPAKWMYSPDFQNYSVPFFMGGIAGMPMSGRRSTDRANLRQALGQPQVWFCHCHHTYSYSGGNNPTADMEFVQALTHIRTYPHLGAVFQWNHDPTNPHHRYYAEQQTVTSISAPQQYADEDIDSFERNQGVILPPFLRRVYQKEQSLSSLWKDDQGNLYELQDILYLTDLTEEPNALSASAVIQLWPSLPVAGTPGKAPLFWGEDACGNLFLTCQGSDTAYFYDHEEDTYTPVRQV